MKRAPHLLWFRIVKVKHSIDARKCEPKRKPMRKSGDCKR